MLRIVASLASRWHSARWVFAVIAGCSLLAILLISVADDAYMQAVCGAIFAAMFSLSWALFLMCIWFHPTMGAVATTSRLANSRPFGRLGPNYAAWFLVIFAVFGAVVVPAVLWTAA
jgi:hypothetical protein